MYVFWFHKDCFVSATVRGVMGFRFRVLASGLRVNKGFGVIRDSERPLDGLS